MQIAAEAQVRIELPFRLLSAGEDRVNHRQREVIDIHITAEVTAPLRVGNLHLAIQLTVVGQANQPAELRTVVMQFGREVQRIEGNRQRRIVDHLGDFDIATVQRHFALRQPLFGGVPADIRIAAEYAAGLGRLRHKRLQHRQIKAVQIHHRPSAGTGVDGLRHAQLGVRVSPAVRPDTDFLFAITVIQRDVARQGNRPYRRLEAGIAQRPFPAFLFTIETPRQRQLPGNRIALHFQLQIVLLFVPFGIQLHEADINPRLADPVDAHIKIAADLVAGLYVALDVDLSNGQLLPAQRTRGDIRQQLRRINGTPHLQQPLRRAAQPRQRIIQIGRIDGGIQVEVFHPQLSLHLGAVLTQRQVQTGDFPLHVAVTLQ